MLEPKCCVLSGGGLAEGSEVCEGRIICDVVVGEEDEEAATRCGITVEMAAPLSSSSDISMSSPEE